jgi:hypothetical protein
MKNLVVFLGLFGIVAFGYGNYLVMAIALGCAALIMYFGFFHATWSFEEFYTRLPTMWQDIPETLELAKETVFFRDAADISSASDFYAVLEDYPRDFEVKYDDALMDAYEEKYDVLVFENHIVSSRVRALYHYFTTREKHPEDIERLADIAQAIMVRKKLDGRPQKSKKKRISFFLPAFN